MGASSGHVERRRPAPESKHLGFATMAGLQDCAEIPRPALAQAYGGQAGGAADPIIPGIPINRPEWFEKLEAWWKKLWKKIKR